MHIPIKNFFRVMAAVILTVTLMGCEAEEAASNKLKDLDAVAYVRFASVYGEELYIAIGYGEQPSGGYSITVNEFYETPDSLFIDTTLLGPGSAENVTDTPTTPYIVIKTENIADKPIEFK